MYLKYMYFNYLYLITSTLIIIIRYCCGIQCELLLNRFLIKELHHTCILNLLCHLPLSSIIDDKIRPTTSFSTPCGKKILRPPYLFSRPPYLQKILTPHLHFDNSITALSQNNWVWAFQEVAKLRPTPPGSS